MRRVPVSDLKPNMVLARAVFSENGHLLLSAGMPIAERYIPMLQARGFMYVDVQDPDTDDLEIPDLISERTRLNVTRDTYRILSAMEGVTRPLQGQDFATLQAEISSEDFGRVAREEFGYEDLVADLGNVVDEVYGQTLLPGLATIRSYDTYLFLHSIDTTIVAVMIGKKLGFDRNRLHQLAAGAILHDIGMVTVDRSVVHKPGRLTPSEMNSIRQHPRLGYEMLRQVRPRDVIPNHVAYQHHERQDGTGYPRGLQGSGRVMRSELERHKPGRILLDAEICAVADVYDALGADRPFRRALPPDQVVRMMRSLAGTHLNREIVNHLLEMLPVYPLGSEVVVQSGPFARYRGVVCRVDRNSLERPVVRLLFDPHGQRIDPIEIDLRRESTVIVSAPVAAAPPREGGARPGVPPAQREEPPALVRRIPAPPSAARSAAVPAYALQERDNAPRAGKVLVVDDDPMIAEVLSEALEEAGHSVVTATAGREALALAGTVDLMLLDLGLPDMDGIDVCRALRAAPQPELARLPVMMLTARGDPLDRIHGIRSGADDYLAKPFDIAEVLARVEALLRSRQIEQALRERNRQLDALRAMVGEVVQAVPVGELAQRIVDAVPRAFGEDSGVIGAVLSVVDRANKTIRVHALTDIPLARRAIETLREPLGAFGSRYDPPLNLLHQAALTGEPRTGAHLAEFVSPTVAPELAALIERTVGMRAGVAQPAKVRGETIAVFLFVLSKPLGQVTATERKLMAELAETAAMPLENARLHAAVESVGGA